MKKYLFYLLTFTFFATTAQIPGNYYDSATGLTGFALKTELHNIISNGHNPQGYNDLWTAYQISDDDQYYESDGTVLDIYSENPNGTDPYGFNFGADQCGNYGGEGDCYNREHLMPQSWFSSAMPMKSDIHHVIPTDGYVNGVRGHLPFGEVGSANYVSANGSKRGNNTVPGYNGEVFEPIDEFKGDIARVYFYMATRYEDKIASWENENDGSMATLNGTSDQVFENWMLDMLLDWHQNDPVSQREIDRNEEAYNFQGNANPFVDHPEFIDMIWGSGMGFSSSQKNEFEMFPNPISTDRLQIKVSEAGTFQMEIHNLLGKLVLSKNISKGENLIDISNLPMGIYLIKISGENMLMTKKLIRK
ncbi:MAG TPA: endonuclease [Flavobacteriaceae bacterium]|nr:endonuclease [Flavobacteriaceae bacterium]